MMRSPQPVQFGAVYKISTAKIFCDIEPASKHLQAAGITGIDTDTAQKIALFGATGDEDFIHGKFKQVEGNDHFSIVTTSTDTDVYERLNTEVPDSDPNKKRTVLQQLIGIAAGYDRYRVVDTFPPVESWDTK